MLKTPKVTQLLHTPLYPTQVHDFIDYFTRVSIEWE